MSYRALQVRFALDAASLEALKEELLYVYAVVDDAGRGLIWTGNPAPAAPEPPPQASLQHRFYALLPEVITLLQRHRRVTYRWLTEVFGLDTTLLTEISAELRFRQIARDEQGQGLVWSGETPPAGQSLAPTPRQQMSADLEAPITTAALPAARAIAAPPDESAHSRPEAERRQLTVMFCDLADSTTLSQQLDAEDLRQVMRAYQATAAEAIAQYEGHIAQYLGDGLLVYFGWPVAHEDDPQRALYAGLGIVAAITTQLNVRLARENGVQLAVRIGIHTGPVVVGAVGAGGRHENLATGDTVNIAARLEGLAAPNTVVIS
jgi:class 3 adenylate cyclase